MVKNSATPFEALPFEQQTLIANALEWFYEEAKDDPERAEAVRDARGDLLAVEFSMRSGWDKSDSHNAERLSFLAGRDLRWIPAWGRWLVWDGIGWRQDPKETVTHEMAKVVGRWMITESVHQIDTDKIGKAGLAALNRGSVINMVHMMRGIDGIALDHQLLDADPYLLGVENGTINLRTGTYQRPRRSDLISMRAPVEWEPDAECPIWERSIAEWHPDPEMQGYIKRLAGSTLIGDQIEHLFIIHYGGGANGKSTFIEVLRDVLGPYTATPHMSLIVQTRNEEHATVLADLFRARLAVASETEKRVKLKEASIKNLTGATTITARRMREDPWDFMPSHSTWLQTNHKPEIESTDHAIWRRVKLVGWDTRFEGAGMNKNLKEQLVTEAPGILRWLVEGCVEYLSDGMQQPEKVTRDTLEYQASEDVIQKWIQDTELVFDPLGEVSADSLTGTWKAWCDANLGEERRWNEPAAYLKNQGCKTKRRIVRKNTQDGDGTKQTFWKGVRYRRIDE